MALHIGDFKAIGGLAGFFLAQENNRFRDGAVVGGDHQVPVELGFHKTGRGGFAAVVCQHDGGVAALEDPGGDPDIKIVQDDDTLLQHPVLADQVQ